MSLTGGRIATRSLRPFVAMANWAIARRASPDAISVAGMAAGVVAGMCFSYAPEHRALWLAGAVLVQLRLLANMLDGMVAVGRGVASRLGELFNEVPDRVSDTAVLVGLGGAAGLWALGFGAALAAIATAYVRAIGKSMGFPADFSGPMAKQQRMAVVTAVAVAMLMLPRGWTTGWPVAALWVVVVGSGLTTMRRLLRLVARL